MEKPERGYQLLLGETVENINLLFIFEKGAIIYPKKFPYGVTLQNPVTAKKIKGKLYGLTAFKAGSQFVGYHDTRLYTFRTGYIFGAYAASARRL